MRRSPVVVVVAVTLTACAKDAERAPAERRNMTALDTIPSLPGAVIVKTTTSGETAPDTSEGPIVGWKTIRELRLTRRPRSEQVIARAVRDLQRSGWRIDGAADFYLNARRERSCLHLLTTADAPTARDAPPPDGPAPPPDGPAPAPDGPAVEPSPTAEPERGDVNVRGLVLSVFDCSEGQSARCLELRTIGASRARQ